MPERALIMLVVSAGLLLLWEFMSLRRKQGPVALWQGAFLIIFAIMFRVSSGWLGMLGAIYLLWPDHTSTYRMIAGGLGFIAGMWIAAIVMQVMNNLLRRGLGFPSRKIEWIRSLSKKRKS